MRSCPDTDIGPNSSHIRILFTKYPKTRSNSLYELFNYFISFIFYLVLCNYLFFLALRPHPHAES